MIRPQVNTYTQYCYWSAVYENSFERLLRVNAELDQILSRPLLQRILAMRQIYRLKRQQVYMSQYHIEILTANNQYLKSLETAL